jgi:hypothetical protein
MGAFVYLYTKSRDPQQNGANILQARNAGAGHVIGLDSIGDFYATWGDLKQTGVKVSRLDISSHGSPGVLDIRGDRLDASDLRNLRGKGYEDLFEPDARVLIYGCNIAGQGEKPGENGRPFLEAFALTFLFKGGGRVSGNTKPTALIPLLNQTILVDPVHALIKKGGKGVRFARGRELSTPKVNWSVRVDGQAWSYEFRETASGRRVSYDDGALFGGQSGEGAWQVRPDVLRIDWPSGSSEDWDLPLFELEQSGLWRKTDGGTEPIRATKLNDLVANRLVD